MDVLILIVDVFGRLRLVIGLVFLYLKRCKPHCSPQTMINEKETLSELLYSGVKPIT